MTPPPLLTAPPPLPRTAVSVVDLQIPFGSMILLMIKWAFAAIPAVMVIWGVILGCMMALGAFFGGIAALTQHLH